MYKEEIEELKEFTIDLTDIDEIALGLEICSKKSNMVIQEFIDTIVQLQQENQELKKENKILRENAEHNDKVVDKVNWENQKLKKQLEEYKLITIDYQELEARNQELKEEIKRVDERNKELVKICQEFDDRINKAIKYISSNDIEVLKYHDIPSETTSYEIVTIDLLKILKGESGD